MTSIASDEIVVEVVEPGGVNPRCNVHTGNFEPLRVSQVAPDRNRREQSDGFDVESAFCMGNIPDITLFGFPGTVQKPIFH